MASDNPLTIYVDRKKKMGRKVAVAFAKGCGGSVELDARPVRVGAIATWGITPSIRPILVEANLWGRRWIYLDHCYIGERYKYFRATDGRFQHTGKGDGDGKRLQRLNLNVKKWRRDGGSVLLCPPGELMCSLRGWKDPARWISETTKELRRYTDRPIIVRYKPAPVSRTEPFDQAIANAWAVVTHISNTALDAMVEGVPAFVTGDCAARAICDTHLSNIESPRYPDRMPLFRVLANNQWTLEEMERGECWETLNGN